MNTTTILIKCLGIWLFTVKNFHYISFIYRSIQKNMEIITVKNVDDVLRVALTKPLKRVQWVEVDKINKDKPKEELSTH